MKVLIADKMSKSAVSALEAMGHTVISNPDLKAEDLPGAIGDAEVLIVRSTKVNAAAIEAGTNLSLIIRAGAGVNTIDLAKASEYGIHVTNCPGKNTEAVAELAIGLMLAADRRIPNATADLRAGQWRKKEYGKAAGLRGRTIGILGLGSIGKAVARRAKALEMNVVAWSRSLTPEMAKELGIGFCASPIDVAKAADVISLHLAAKPETTHMVNADFLDQMKSGAILVNTARGEIVDWEALQKAIPGKQLRVASDVFAAEPAGGEAPFEQTALAGMLEACTPHIGASTDQASEAIAAEAVRIVKVFQETGTPPNVVNIRKKTVAVINLVVRHFNKVGVIAGVLDILRTASINVEEMENLIFEGGTAACCTLKLDKQPDNDVLAQIRASGNVISAALK
ncbi:MAG: NAD(P)-binding domain-containing protein [Verrucomicrobiota bacterium]|jgi:D-3-phosphoglycerate dehydrogenase|nr:NAD(P)-binding domain-containing protein [Verrucomicrobiota bacterium]